jgi:hypothetical protein
MDLASFLKRSANVFMIGVMARAIVQDLSTEVRTDVVRSPYGAMGVATLLGVVGGLTLGRRQARRSRLRATVG